ncbi:MAG: BtpA/SgcQ family protein [Asgard group archaeon]|nr:BtpA/SgcQ family protein [Asgard group archaeon]
MSMSFYTHKLQSFHALFSNTSKPIIGMIHLPALPGSPKHTLDFDEISSHALSDLNYLIKSGVDGVLVENFHDNPFLKSEIPLLTLIPFTLLVQRIAQNSTIPVGVNLLRNACEQALTVASFTGADFIRCNFFTGAYISDQGIIEGCAASLKRYQKQLQGTKTISQPKIFADIHCKHAAPLSSRSLDLEVQDAFERGLADGIIITGERTGLPTKIKDLQLLQSKDLAPILIGSGLTYENVDQLLPLAHGAIVGSYFKKDGLLSNPIDSKKVGQFIAKVKEIRKNL